HARLASPRQPDRRADPPRGDPDARGGTGLVGRGHHGRVGVRETVVVAGAAHVPGGGVASESVSDIRRVPTAKAAGGTNQVPLATATVTARFSDAPVLAA